MGSCLRDLRRFPLAVRESLGFAIYLAQTGEHHLNAKPLKGFGGAGVLEVVEDFNGDTFRAVYTVRFATAVYVLHVFQKKAKTGSRTPKVDIDLVRSRLRAAETKHRLRTL